MKVPSNARFANRSTLSIALASTLILGCGGGSDSGGGGTLGGIDGGDTLGPIGSSNRVFVSGAINGFGSVIVNGIAYETAGAQIIADGQPVTEDVLKVGQIVSISATLQGTEYVADRVVYDKDLEGPVQSIDLLESSLVVLGQTVHVNNLTSFEDDISPRSLEGLSAGDFIEVSGYINSSRDIIATRIELEDDEEYEITGLVSNLDTSAMSFNINNLVVDYSQASFDDFDDGQIANGDLVEVEGDQIGGSGELIADSVEREDDFRDDDDFGDDLDDSDIEIEGLITRFESATDFDVRGIPVTTNSNTEFDDGSAGDLALDVLVEVEGRFNSEGILVAEEIEFEDEGIIEIEAWVDDVDVDARRVILLGIDVEINDETRMEDDDDRYFSIEDISVGEWLEVRGREEEPGTNLLTATRIERDDDDDEEKITGFASDVSDPGFRILGLDIDTTPGTEFDDIDRAAFFDTAEGRLVEVEGSYDGNTFLATEVELEDDDDNDDDDD